MHQPWRYSLRPSSELAEQTSEARPYWDSHLAASHGARRDFTRTLQRAKLITWRLEKNCSVGAFFVRKKQGLIRLVLDCRPANALHQRPPHSNLATVAAVGAMDLSPEWIAHGRAAPDPEEVADLDRTLASGLSVAGAGIDLLDSFYQFLAPTMSSYFCLDEVFTAADTGVTEVFYEATGEMQSVDDAQPLWACFAGLPMGWSWALYYARESLRQCSLRAFARLGAEPQLVVDGGPPPRATWAAGYIAPYADNGNVVGYTAEATVASAAALEKELVAASFAVRSDTQAAELGAFGARSPRSFASGSSRRCTCGGSQGTWSITCRCAARRWPSSARCTPTSATAPAGLVASDPSCRASRAPRTPPRPRR